MIIFYVLILIVSCIGIRFTHFNNDYLSRKNTIVINGIFCLFIFARHFSGYVELGDNFLDESFLYLDEILGQLIVVSFLFFSGYGIATSIYSKEKYLNKFVYRRFLPLYFQFALYVTLYLLISYIPNIGTAYSTKDILLSYSGWSSIGNSNWFMFVTFVQYIIVYISFRFLKSNKFIAGLCFSTILSIFVLIILSIYKTSHWYNTLLCFNLGMWYAFFKKQFDSIMKNPKTYWVITIIVTILFAGSFVAYRKFDENVFIVTSLLFALLLTFILMKVKLGNVVLTFFGVNCFGIYMLQRAPLIILSHYLSNPYLLFVVSFIITVILSTIFNFIFSGLKRGQKYSLSNK